MTEQHTASRTLVKSAPELWAECSVAESLARHLGEFGEIRITRLEPETTVAWEGTRASGMVRLEPAGWGTQVTLTAVADVTEVAEVAGAGVVVVDPEPIAAAEPERAVVLDPETVAAAEPERVPVTEREPLRASKRRFRDRLRWFFNGPQPQPPQQEPEPEGESRVQPEPEPEPELEPTPVVDAEPAPRPVVQPEPGPEPGPEPMVVAPTEPALDPKALLTAALDSLGQAHHRPFSRA
jgi:hypothetical protein